MEAMPVLQSRYKARSYCKNGMKAQYCLSPIQYINYMAKLLNYKLYWACSALVFIICRNLASL